MLGLRRLTSLRHDAVALVKRVVYGRRGEPYPIPGHTLRFVPGTRPVRLRYVDSQNGVARFDALQLRWLLDHLRPGDVAIDVGAHSGACALPMAARCGPSGTVVAFEPDPFARALLERNIALNPGLKAPIVERAACSDTAGEATLFSRGGNAQSSLVRSAVEFAPDQKAETIRVPLITLDAYLETRGLATPRCVKIDAEGAEIRILRGAPKLLASGADLLVELHPYAWAEFGDRIEELRELAARAGRSIRYLGASEDLGERVEYGTVLLRKRP